MSPVRSSYWARSCGGHDIPQGSENMAFPLQVKGGVVSLLARQSHLLHLGDVSGGGIGRIRPYSCQVMERKSDLPAIHR